MSPGQILAGAESGAKKRLKTRVKKVETPSSLAFLCVFLRSATYSQEIPDKKTAVLPEGSANAFLNQTGSLSNFRITKFYHHKSQKSIGIEDVSPTRKGFPE